MKQSSKYLPVIFLWIDWFCFIIIWALNLCTNVKIWLVLLDFVILDYYVHRLVASKTDGKMVQYECEGDTSHAEKIDALQLEVGISGRGCSFLLWFCSIDSEMLGWLVCVCSTHTCWQVNWSLRGFTGRIRLFTWRRKQPRRCEDVHSISIYCVVMAISDSSTTHVGRHTLLSDK